MLGQCLNRIQFPHRKCKLVNVLKNSLDNVTILKHLIPTDPTSVIATLQYIQPSIEKIQVKRPKKTNKQTSNENLQLSQKKKQNSEDQREKMASLIDRFRKHFDELSRTVNNLALESVNDVSLN